MTHELKTQPEYFQAVINGDKRFEVRINDRGFQTGDKLILKEIDKNQLPTGRIVSVRVDYLFHAFGLQPWYCIMSITPINTVRAMTDEELK